MLRLEVVKKKMEENHRDLGLMSSQGSAPVIDGLKEEIFRVIRDKIEIEMLDNARVAKTVNLELQVKQLTESLKISHNQEALLCAKILKLEATEKNEMSRKYVKALSEKRDEIEEVKASHKYEIAELLGEVGRVREVMDELKGSYRELQEKNEELLSQVCNYKHVVGEVMLEKDHMRKGFEAEKTQVKKNLELQLAGMKKKLEQAEAKLGQVRNEKRMLNKRKKELVSNFFVWTKEKDALKNTLLEAQQERDDLNRILRNKRSNPTEETSLRKKGKFEKSHVQGENVLESDHDFRRSKEDNCSTFNPNASSGPNYFHCPDAEFNDFEKDREEDRFAVNQIWAIYENPDILPRSYALVMKVYVASPLKLKISSLEPGPDDQGEKDWHDADLPIACGKFKLGGSETVTDRTIFSHQIQCMKRSCKGFYMVYPKKGETWAIFRDWNIKWSLNPKNHLTDEFEYVEILSDFTQNVGIQVAYLVKVEGFVSLFQSAKKNGVNMFCVLPNELYRFSHRIPSCKMTGNEREGVPRGCFEFDTAALPTNFFDIVDSGDAENGPQSSNFTKETEHKQV